MIQMNMFEAKSKLSKLVADLESHTNDEVILARNGKPVAKIIPLVTHRSIVGAGVGQVELPSIQELEQLDEEYLSEFEEELL